MKYAPITDRLAHLGGAKWDVHFKAKQLAEQGRDVIELTIGEPDVPAPTSLINDTIQSLRSGRTEYSNGRGEPGLLDVLARKYTKRSGREITTDQILCFPGTQTALYAAMMGLVSDGDQVLVADPMYATYEGVISATGAHMIGVPLRPENGFRMAAQDVIDRITPQCRVLFLNTPHNPTGAVLSASDIAELGEIARAHDLWILSDEVYEELIFDNATLNSPLDHADLAERTIVVSSISKSHAAPGFRSGWSVGPTEFSKRLLPVSETMLFGNQPFIADATARALSQPSDVARGMRNRLSHRADIVVNQLQNQHGLHVQRPEAGMFTLLNISATGLTSQDYAMDLLEKTGVAVMPGSSFGETLDKWVRLALTVDNDVLNAACARILTHAAMFQTKAAT